ncbi:MAG: 30S ribosomal protein S17 [Deltaproteobacteria bacterium]|nr:MAG: 30S ribosomal protein S17 [Deltaproteobacteria bacterium]
MRGQRKIKAGTVVSVKMNKTAVVQVKRLDLDSTYHKYVRRLDNYKAHDEKGECRVGDRVEIAEVSPISKTKRWRIVRFVQKVDTDNIEVQA